ncbi:MAG TPA: transaldolase [Acidimicrobiales bacterium]|nr:transaldolase [Acidimicrobiales bacterium]
MTKTRLQELWDEQRQSPWLDNLRRDYITNGHLQELIDQGIRGITSNPTIFAKAIEGEDDYDAQFAQELRSHSVDQAYWELVIKDIVDACGLLRPVHEASDGVDGYVSVEVEPSLAHDAKATVAAARALHNRINLPNLFVKIPATIEGVDAIRTMIGEGRSINVTLIFSLERYTQVMEAYLGGLEDLLAKGTSDLSGVRSVASFFVSRVDTEVDRRLEAAASGAGEGARQELLAARGTAALAQAQVAYQRFLGTFRDDRWDALVARGAKVQRPLWASTSTKNPSYSDLLYVDNLIGPDTVNTLPDQTIAAFLDHGSVKRTVDDDPGAASARLGHLEDLGIDMADVANTLEDEGVASFSKSFEELIQSLTDKANALSSRG